MVTNSFTKVFIEGFLIDQRINDKSPYVTGAPTEQMNVAASQQPQGCSQGLPLSLKGCASGDCSGAPCNGRAWSPKET